MFLLLLPIINLVLSVKSISKQRSVQGQNIIQTTRKKSLDAKEQQWEFVSTDKDNIFYLRLRDFEDYYLNDKQVPSFQQKNSVDWMILNK